MVDGARRRATYAEHVAIANDSEVKYESISGELVAMPGGTVAHARLIGRVSSAPLESLGPELGGDDVYVDRVGPIVG
jgi:hypothetical protein